MDLLCSKQLTGADLACIIRMILRVPSLARRLLRALSRHLESRTPANARRIPRP